MRIYQFSGFGHNLIGKTLTDRKIDNSQIRTFFFGLPYFLYLYILHAKFEQNPPTSCPPLSKRIEKRSDTHPSSGDVHFHNMTSHLVFTHFLMLINYYYYLREDESRGDEMGGSAHR